METYQGDHKYSQLIYKPITIQIKIQTKLFKELDKLILKSIKIKGSRIDKTILYMKNLRRGFVLTYSL